MTAPMATCGRWLRLPGPQGYRVRAGTSATAAAGAGPERGGCGSFRSAGLTPYRGTAATVQG